MGLMLSSFFLTIFLENDVMFDSFSEEVDGGGSASFREYTIWAIVIGLE